MKMSKSLMCAAGTLMAVQVAAEVYAQSAPVQAKAAMTEATLYFRGAELTQTASATVIKGANEIIIEGLSPVIDVSTLRVKSTGGVVISSTEFSIDYTSDSKAIAPGLKKLEQELEALQEEYNQINIDLNINNQMISYLRSGVQKNVSGSESGMGIDELKKTMEYFKAQATELETANTNLKKRSSELSDKISNLNSQIYQERIKGSKTSGVLKINASAPISGTSQFTITYFTSAASWQPVYDINIAAVERPVVINTRAKVSQTTGMDWNKVRLTLSTAVPSNGKIAPLFSAWFLREQSVYREYMSAAQNRYDYAEESVMMDVAEISSSEKLTGSGYGAKASVMYLVDGMVMDEYEYESMDQSYVKSVEVVTDKSLKKQYGNPETLIKVTLKDMNDFVSNSENDLNIVYNIDIPYTIPGNGKEQAIDINRQETTATYSYYSAAKLDPSVYLLAKLPGWESLGLMSGRANVTFDGTYIGETYIDTSTTQNDLTLTLGTDPRVTVKREQVKNFSSTKTFGNSVQQTFTYKITVRNNRNNAIDMVVKDQYPISTDSSIEVTLNTKETTKWTENVESLGVISWEERFEAGETKEYIISYTVKYPKNMNLNF